VSEVVAAGRLSSIAGATGGWCATLGDS
jgi:hypothetical protein